MCESNVYLAQQEGEILLMGDVGWLEVEGGRINMRDLDGAQKSVTARLKHADLVQHHIVLEPVPAATGSLAEVADRAAAFHGHLGPFLVFGLRMGLLARQRLGFEGHFDVKVRAFTGRQTPVSCIVDGLQVSTGATLGKGNIEVLDIGHDGPAAAFEAGAKSLKITLTSGALELSRRLEDDEATSAAARKAMEMDDAELFDVAEGGLS